MEFKITLEENELQKVLDSLVKLPYVDVFEVINKIQEQASEQMQSDDK